MQASVVVDRVEKRFGPTVALRDVSFCCQAGSVHGLIGENGAGKSTFVKILSGVLRPDAGRILAFGNPMSHGSPYEARRAGIATVFQELMLVPHMSVAHNLLLGREPHSALGIVGEKALNRAAQQGLAEVGIEDIAADRPVDDLPLASKQKLSIAAALLQRPRALLLDEPTSALGPRDVDWLFQTVGRLLAGGVTILIVSHRLPEIRRICQRFTILRDGAVMGTFERDEIEDAEIIRHMIGRSLSRAFPGRPEPVAAPTEPVPPLLEVEDLSGTGFDRISLQVRPGEIVGVGGLQGHGHRELFLALFGDLPAQSGEIRVSGLPLAVHSPRDAIAAGIALIPEERKTEGLLLELSGRENVALPSLRRLSRFGLVRAGEEAPAVAAFFDRLGVSRTALHRPVKAFSGGTQQKMLFSKWLLTRARALLLYDPTRGVDVGAKYETYLMMRDLAANGAALLFYSSDVEELVHLPDRVIILYDGRVCAELSGAEQTSETIMAAIVGIGRGPQPSEVGTGGGRG